MAVGVLMPKIGITVESCVITEWKKKPGDAVEAGDILFSYETDKAALDCESTATGTLLEIFYGNGEEVPVLVNVCAIGSPGDDVSALRHAPEGNGEVTPLPAKPTRQEERVLAVESAEPGELKISPKARRLAETMKIDLRAAEPSGPYGRVIERDVRDLAKKGVRATSAVFGLPGQQPLGSRGGTGIGGRVRVEDFASAFPDVRAEGSAEYEDIAASGIRKAIAKSMALSLQTIPQLTHHFSFDATEIMSLRGKIKEKGGPMGLGSVGIGDMINFAVSRIILKYPPLNAHMLDNLAIRQFRGVNLGFACDTERGLMVPVIMEADRKSLAGIASEAKSLAKQAQSGAMSPDLMAGGTFTVSNLGPYGVESFTPVINPPQTGILGVCCATPRPYEENGRIELRPAIGLSLTYDHRAVDGAPASRFARELCKALENFTVFMMAAS